MVKGKCQCVVGFTIVLALNAATCLEGGVRLKILNNYPEPYELIEDELARGRVEVCVGRRYGTVCDDFWDNADASVVCKQLGFSPYGELLDNTAMTNCVLYNNHRHHYTGAVGGRETFGDGLDNAILRNIGCVGNESQLLNCSHSSSGSAVECGSIEDAHVVCQGVCSVCNPSHNYVCTCVVLTDLWYSFFNRTLMFPVIS